MHATLVRPAKGFWGRSIDELKRLSGIVFRAEGVKGPSGPYTLHTFQDNDSVSDCKLITDSEIGGYSTAHFDYVPPVQASTLTTSSSSLSSPLSSPSSPDSSSPSTSSPEVSQPRGYARFHGVISTRLPESRPEVQRSGYAAWRTADPLPTLFGPSLWNVDSYAYLAMRIRSDGRSYLINVQTDSMVAPTDLHQHRLFARRPGHWETVLVPWAEFVRTNHGFVVEPQTELLRQRVKSIGLGLTDRTPGPFELCIAKFWATNNPHETDAGSHETAEEQASDVDATLALHAENGNHPVVNIPFSDPVSSSSAASATTPTSSPRAAKSSAPPSKRPASKLRNKRGVPISWNEQDSP